MAATALNGKLRLGRWSAMLVVLTGHAVALAALTGFKPEPRPVETPPRPIMVSMVAAAQPPAPLVEPPPAPPPPEPPKPKRKPKPKPKPVPKPKPLPMATAPEPPSAPPAPPVEQVRTAPAPAPAVTTIAPQFEVAYLRNPAPEYPRASRRRGEQGQVLLRVRVTTVGRPAEVELERSSGYRRLDQAAIDTVRRWRFVPASRAGDAVEADVLVPINFRLES